MLEGLCLGAMVNLWPHAVESSIAIEAAVDYGGLNFKSCLFFRGVSDAISPLSRG